MSAAGLSSCSHASIVIVEVNFKSSNWRTHARQTDLLTVGEVARRSGFAASALRFYEREGLIAATRTTGNQRRYQRSVLRRLAFIRAARNVGLSLDEVAAALATLPDGRNPTKADWTRLSRSWRDRLDEQIAALREAARRPGLVHRLRLPVAAEVRDARTRRRRRPAPGRVPSYLPAARCALSPFVRRDSMTSAPGSSASSAAPAARASTGASRCR